MMKSISLKSLALATCFVSMNAFAIVDGTPDCEPMFGTPDQCGHPYVGSYAVQYLSDGSYYQAFCAATLIHLDDTAVAITAAHCVYPFAGGPFQFKVSFDSRAFEQTPDVPLSLSDPMIFDDSRYVDVAEVVMNPAYVATQLAGKDNFNTTEPTDMALLLIDAENTAKIKEMWSSVSPANLPSENLLDDIGHYALKDALTHVGYGLNQIVTNGSASPEKTVKLTTAGERRVGKVNYRTHTPKGTIFIGENANHLDAYDGSSKGDSGSPILYGDTLVGILKGGMPSVWGVGPRVDTPDALDFICTYVPDSTPPCGDRD